MEVTNKFILDYGDPNTDDSERGDDERILRVHTHRTAQTVNGRMHMRCTAL